VGSQYRSGIYHQSPEQAQLARAYIEALAASGVYRYPIVTEILRWKYWLQRTTIKITLPETLIRAIAPMWWRPKWPSSKSILLNSVSELLVEFTSCWIIATDL